MDITKGNTLRDSYGLHHYCSALTNTCTTFPRFEDCTGDERHFCSAWRSTGFLMSFAVVVELSCVIAFGVILLGGRQKREVGWKVLGWLLGVAAVSQAICMSVVVSLFLILFHTSMVFGKVENWGMNGSIRLTTDRLQAYLYNHDAKFAPGWRLDMSWILATVSWCVLTLDATFIVTSAFVLPSEGDYELIPDRPGQHSGI
ncbi:MAG: hypothetical protein M1822_000393 [Bathelium mastoideum]|nr:MAG: hypothetical protein M1822_000393 [Bathelium mastoideum]